MRGPIDEAEDRTTGRARGARPTTERNPHGKALRRIEYFELQRGLPQIIADGRVASAAAAAEAPQVGKRGPARKRTGPARYKKAAAVKAAMIPTFAASVELPVWRPLGPSLIPKGQTYGTGGNNTPPVSGRAVGIVISATN